MKLITRFATTIAVVGAATLVPATATQAADTEETGRMMLVLDFSGSMKEKAAGGVTKIEAAKQALNDVIDGLPAKQDVGLRVYGAKVFSRDDKGACTDSQRIVDLGTDNRADLKAAVSKYKPFGETPIGFALQEAGKDLGGEGQRTIVLVSDGEPTCDPDPCKVAAQLSKKGIDLRIDVVGLDVDGKARDKLKCIADKGNGTYYDADSAEELTESLTTTSVRASRPFDLTGTPVKGTPRAANAPTLKTGQYLDTIPLNDGLWYKIKRTTKNSTIHVGVTNKRQAGWALNNVLNVKTYTDPDRSACNSEQSFPHGSLGYASATTWKNDPADECNTAGTTYVHVERASNSEEIVGQPIEVAVYEEPPLADPSGRDLAAAPEEPQWSTLKPAAPAADLVPGTSISNAPVVDDGTYAFDINPGETQVLALPLDWGQSLRAQFDAPLTPEILQGGGDGPNVAILGPLRDRSRVDFYGSAPEDWTTAAFGNLRYGDDKAFRIGAQTQSVAFSQRTSGESDKEGAAVPGIRYVQVSYNVRDGAPMRYTLTLKTDGTAGEGGPKYAKVDGLTPPSADSRLTSGVAASGEAGSDGPEAKKADGSPDSGGFPLVPIGLGVIGVIALGAAALVFRKSRTQA